MGDSKKRGEMGGIEVHDAGGGVGLEVRKPCGESRGYHFVVEAGGPFLRVQVKSPMARIVRGSGYLCCLMATHHSSYSTEEVDAFAIYASLAGVWLQPFLWTGWRMFIWERGQRPYIFECKAS